MKAPKKKRARRTGEDARAAILDAAEKHLAAVGPAGIRLQDVANDVGVSHPAILHHFGDREGLIHAVVDRAMTTLEEDLVTALTQQPHDEAAPPDPTMLLERVFETLGDRGHARLLAWLLLSGYKPFASDASRANWKKIADVTHAGRVELLQGQATPTYEDTLFTLVLSSLAMFGEALAGPAVFKSASLDDRAAPRRFREWFGALVLRHLSGQV